MKNLVSRNHVFQKLCGTGAKDYRYLSSNYTVLKPHLPSNRWQHINKREVMDYCNHILQLNKYRLNVSTTPKIRSSKPRWIEENLHHQHLPKTKKPPLVFIGDSITYEFKRYKNIWDNHFGKQTVNCGIKGDRTENLIYKIEDLVIPQHVKKFVII